MLDRYIARQLARPTGLGGRIIMGVINRQNRRMYEAVCENAPAVGNILDVGFGNGHCIEQLAKITDATIFGVDISEDMVRTASKRNKKAAGEGKVILSHGSAEDIPFDERFDLIYTINTVYFWPDLDKGYEAIAQKLADNGAFLNLFYTKEVLDRTNKTQYGFAKYTADELREAAERSGLAAEIKEIEKDVSYLVRAVK